MTGDQKLSLRHRIYTSRVSYLMIAPFILIFVLFTVLPILSSVVLSFTNFNMLETPGFIGLKNYQRLLLDDDVFLIAVKNTLIFVFIDGPISYFLALMMAWIINEMPRRFRQFMTLVFFAPSVAGNVYFLWQYLFSGDSYGLVNGVLMKLGILSEPVLWFKDPDYNLAIIIIVQLWLSLGVSFLAFIAGFQSVDSSQYEAAAIDGIHNRYQEFWLITLPNIKDMLLFGAVMQIAGTFSVGSITQALSGGYMSVGYSAHTIINHIADFGFVRYEMGYASAVAVVLFIAVILTKNLIFRLLKW